MDPAITSPAPASSRLNPVSGVNAWIRWALIAIVAVSLWSAHDRNGYEGDDLSMFSAIIDLDHAKQGDLFLYRYSWQPLSYELGSAVYRFTGNPDAIFGIAPVCGAITFALLLLTLECRAHRLDATGYLAAILALFPELFYDSLFFNSTIVGMPTTAAALGLLLTHEGPFHPARSALIGALMTISCLCRFDFLLMFPLFAAIIALRGQPVRNLAAIALIALLLVLSAVAIGLLKPAEMLDTLRIHREETDVFYRNTGWNLGSSLRVLLTIFAPPVWPVLLLGLPRVIREFQTSRGWPALTLLALASLPLFYPLKDFLSPKYAIPLLMFMPFLIQEIFESFCRDASAPSTRRFMIAFTAVAIAFWLVSIEPMKQAPFLRITTTDPKPFHTADGRRSLGAFLPIIAQVNRDESAEPRWRAAARMIAELERAPERAVWFIGDDDTFKPGKLGWRCARLLLARRNLHAEWVAPRACRYTLPNGARLFLVETSRNTPDLQAQLAPDALTIDCSDPQISNDQLLQLVEKTFNTSP